MRRITNNKLINAAKAACERAYAPYSNFRVGAAIAIDDGTIATGSNVENASYGLTICAERAAVFGAVAAGARSFSCIAVAVATPGDDNSTLMPCGACLQVLTEFMPPDGKILIAGVGEFALKDLLPHSFALPRAKEKP
jgi:cytidine deaminase